MGPNEDIVGIRSLELVEPGEEGGDVFSVVRHRLFILRVNELEAVRGVVAAVVGNHGQEAARRKQARHRGVVVPRPGIPAVCADTVAPGIRHIAMIRDDDREPAVGPVVFGHGNHREQHQP